MSFSDADTLRILCAKFQQGDQAPFLISDSEMLLDIDDSNGTAPSIVTSYDRALSVEAITRDGLVDSRPVTLYLTAGVGFIEQLSRGTASPKTSVQIFELEFQNWRTDPMTPEVSFWFDGFIGTVQVHPDGRPGQVALTLIDAKSALDRQVGMIAADECANIFGDGKTCLYDINANSETGTAVNIQGLVISIPGLPSRPTLWWEAGFIRSQGVDIAISQWVNGDDFVLAQLPPASWTDFIPSLPIEIFPGCSLNARDCSLFGQDERFNALGIGMLTHHPQFERPL